MLFGSILIIAFQVGQVGSGRAAVHTVDSTAAPAPVMAVPSRQFIGDISGVLVRGAAAWRGGGRWDGLGKLAD